MDTPNNAELRRALDALKLASEDEMPARFIAALNTFAESTLLTCEETYESEEGGDYLALFTDIIELFSFENGARHETITAKDAIKAVNAGEYDGLVINCAGNALELEAEDVREIFEIEE
jgi:hypothetical protein